MQVIDVDVGSQADAISLVDEGYMCQGKKRALYCICNEGEVFVEGVLEACGFRGQRRTGR